MTQLKVHHKHEPTVKMNSKISEIKTSYIWANTDRVKRNYQFFEYSFGLFFDI